MADNFQAHASGKLKLEEKAAIIALSKEGKSTSVIAKNLARNRVTIHRLLKKAKGLPHFTNPKRKIGTGRPRIMSPFLVGALRRRIGKFPMMTAADLRKSVPELQAVSEHTINVSFYLAEKHTFLIKIV